MVAWIVTAFCDGVIGLILGLALLPVVTKVINPVIGAVMGSFAQLRKKPNANETR